MLLFLLLLLLMLLCICGRADRAAPAAVVRSRCFRPHHSFDFLAPVASHGRRRGDPTGEPAPPTLNFR